MRFIEKQTWVEQKKSYNGVKYHLYHYRLDDGSEVTSLEKFNVGDRVEHWFDHGWGIPKIRLYKEKRPKE